MAAGLIWRSGRLLITKRPAGRHLAGFWEFPGGKKEAYETLKECLEREIKEELGIDIQTEKSLISVHHEYETKFITLHVFHCTIRGGRPAPLEDQESRWVDPEDLKDYTFPPPDIEVIETLMKVINVKSKNRRVSK